MLTFTAENAILSCAGPRGVVVGEVGEVGRGDAGGGFWVPMTAYQEDGQLAREQNISFSGFFLQQLSCPVLSVGQSPISSYQRRDEHLPRSKRRGSALSLSDQVAQPQIGSPPPVPVAPPVRSRLPKRTRATVEPHAPRAQHNTTAGQHRFAFLVACLALISGFSTESLTATSQARDDASLDSGLRSGNYPPLRQCPSPRQQRCSPPAQESSPRVFFLSAGT